MAAVYRPTKTAGPSQPDASTASCEKAARSGRPAALLEGAHAAVAASTAGTASHSAAAAGTDAAAVEAGAARGLRRGRAGSSSAAVSCGAGSLISRPLGLHSAALRGAAGWRGRRGGGGGGDHRAKLASAGSSTSD